MSARRYYPFITQYDQHRSEIVHHEILVKEAAKGGWCGAEIGVKQGDFSVKLLQSNCKKLYLIDPWETQSATIYDETIHDHNEDYLKCIENIKPYEGKYQIMRKYSSFACKYIEDESLDFVYIDGNHSYEGVKNDINDFIPKLKKGGIMMGDDYHGKPIEEKFGAIFGVKKAVDEYCSEHNINVSLQYYGDWYYPLNPDEVNTPHSEWTKGSEQYQVVYPSKNWYFIKQW